MSRIVLPWLYCGAIGLALGATLIGASGAGRHGPPGAAKPPASAPHFGRDIRPLISDRCFKCHGPDAAKREANLRLDTAEGATAPRKEGPAVVPGDPEASELFHRISSSDPKYRMPPADSNKRPLSAEEQELVRRWIADGARYEAHWAFVAPVRPVEPVVRDAAWSRNPIDRFILARLEADGIEPSPEASKSALLRRVFLDLTGLPPTPEELDEFLADTRPDAYERWVDRLLTTEPYRSRYGERMAVPWMDQARFADTCGIHMDAGRQMWLWRDYVIKAYRDNMPFDRFLTEQLAGDLMPGATDDQKIASGFNRNHVTTDEGGAIAEEYLVEYAVDRTATTGSVFLGLTVACARCHDHKFDPISTEEFYRLYAYFGSIEEPGLYSQTPDPNRAHEPFIIVPTPQQKEAVAKLTEHLAALNRRKDERTPEEEQERGAFMADVVARAGVAWVTPTVTGAASPAGTVLTAQPDGSVLASGPNPKQDEYQITLRTEAVGLRLLLLEALADAATPEGGAGRAPNGNAVVTGISAEAISIADPSLRTPIRLAWGWADHSQADVDSTVTNLFDGNPARGWAIDAHRMTGGRVVLLMADAPFGFPGGTELRVTIQQKSVYELHNLLRVRLSVGALSEAGLGLLPSASGRWYVVGPFMPDKDGNVFEPSYGPEEGEFLDLGRTFAEGTQAWRFDASLMDGRLNPLPEGRNVFYVAKDVFSPTDRNVEVSLGSDDGFRLSVNGKEVAANKVDRALSADQDKAVIPLRAGRNTVVMKIVNTGGPAGFYFRPAEAVELAGDMVGALLPSGALSARLASRLEQSWRITHLPRYKQLIAEIAAAEKETAQINASMPQTMVMKELAEARPTFVLTRGQYDKPDQSRPVSRGVPSALGQLPDGAPADRLGLAAWLTSPDQPLVARVTVNRLWELCFGTGLVRTTEDFGYQGDWPSHPELLDWLSVEFRERGWDVQHVLRLIVTSSTYRQSSRVRPEVRERDPDNRLLAYFPRHRLSAEQTRDQALYVAGLLIEKLGGPSVKPYQPEGLWQEVAMVQSNTREYVRGMGDDLWRRSLYTYWKRAAPPPAMLTLDAPTREFCTIRRASTSTPLQALVLWNDEQFVEASRVLAQRTLQAPGDDASRLSTLFRRCTGRVPEPDELAALGAALADFRERYRAAPADAQALLKKGVAPVPAELDPAEVASWTLVANAVLNLYEATTQE